jgi:hypothetical protein
MCPWLAAAARSTEVLESPGSPDRQCKPGLVAAEVAATTTEPVAQVVLVASLAAVVAEAAAEPP